MKLIKSKIALILALLMVLTVFSACGGNDDNSKPDSSKSSSESTNVSGTNGDNTDRKNAKDNLPERNFDGREFRIFTRTEYEYEFKADDVTNEFINDIIHDRNAAVEERFGVKIVTSSQLGDWGFHDQFITDLRAKINSDSDDFDLIAGYAAVIPQLVSENLFYNWYDIKYIDFEQPWWSQDIIKELTINDKMYLLTGDISLVLLESMFGMFFNKTLAEEYDVGNLYELVKQGDWTFDKMVELAKKVNKDNGDSVWTAEDTYGYMTARTTQVDVYLNAFNIPVTEKDSDGLPHYTVNQRKTYDVVDKIYDFICVQPCTYYGEFVSPEESAKEYANGRALFMPADLNMGKVLKDYSINYGILPMPKYDENQDEYYSTSKDNFSLFAVPITAPDTEFVGIITEALCAESYRSVVEEYYKTILQNRYTTDDDAPEMINIIREGLLFNFGYIYSLTLDWPAHLLNICINDNSPEFASKWQAKESIFETKLQEVLDVYRE